MMNRKRDKKNLQTQKIVFGGGLPDSARQIELERLGDLIPPDDFKKVKKQVLSTMETEVEIPVIEGVSLDDYEEGKTLPSQPVSPHYNISPSGSLPPVSQFSQFSQVYNVPFQSDILDQPSYAETLSAEVAAVIEEENLSMPSLPAVSAVTSFPELPTVPAEEEAEGVLNLSNEWVVDESNLPDMWEEVVPGLYEKIEEVSPIFHDSSRRIIPANHESGLWDDVEIKESPVEEADFSNLPNVWEEIEEIEEVEEDKGLIPRQDLLTDDELFGDLEIPDGSEIGSHAITYLMVKKEEPTKIPEEKKNERRGLFKRIFGGKK